MQIAKRLQLFIQVCTDRKSFLRDDTLHISLVTSVIQEEELGIHMGRLFRRMTTGMAPL